jgi:hypothetical protein
MLDSPVRFAHLERYLVCGRKSGGIDLFKVGLENAVRDGRRLYQAILVLITFLLLGTCDIRSTAVPRAGYNEAGWMNDVALSNVMFDGYLRLQTTCSSNNVARTDRIGKRAH